MPVESAHTLRVFVSGCSVDRWSIWHLELSERLDVHLHELGVKLWDNSGVLHRDLRIEQDIAQADAAILLVSHEYIYSRFIREVELPIIERRSREGKLTVIPIVVEPDSGLLAIFLRERRAPMVPPVFYTDPDGWDRVRHEVLIRLGRCFDWRKVRSRDTSPRREYAASSERECVSCEPPEVGAEPTHAATEQRLQLVLPRFHHDEESCCAVVTDDTVDCSVFSREQVRPRDRFLVRVFAHKPSQAGAVARLVHEADNQAKRIARQPLDEAVPRGARLTFVLSIPKLKVDEPTRSLVWTGGPKSVDFEVSVPWWRRNQTVIGRVVVNVNSVPVGHVKFTIEVKRRSTATAVLKQVGRLFKRYERAFISYSRKDIDRVKDCARGLSTAKVRYRQDIWDIEPGDEFMPRLQEYIEESDLFLLFWSKAASRSKWVRKEVRHALHIKGDQLDAPPEIVPVTLEKNPPRPWRELSHLSFPDERRYFESKP